MNLMIISALESKAVSLAEKLSAKHQVRLFHTGRIVFECPFSETEMDPLSHEPLNLSGVSWIVYCCSPSLPASLLARLLEQAKECPDARVLCLYENADCRAGEAQGVAEKYVCRAFVPVLERRLCYIETPAVYDNDFLPPELMTEAVNRPKRNEMVLQGNEQDLCDLLHAGDLLHLIERLMDFDTLPASLRVSGGRVVPMAALGDLLYQCLRLTNIKYSEETSQKSIPAPYDTVEGWMPVHAFSDELPDIIDSIETEGILGIRFRRSRMLKEAGRFLLFLVLFVCVCLYTGFIQVSSELQFVDIRLLYVIGISLFMGSAYGLGAGLLCCLASIVQSMAAGVSWQVIFFHVDNWIPCAVYLAAAILFGMQSGNRKTNDR